MSVGPFYQGQRKGKSKSFDGKPANKGKDKGKGKVYNLDDSWQQGGDGWWHNGEWQQGAWDNHQDNQHYAQNLIVVGVRGVNLKFLALKFWVSPVLILKILV